MMTPIFQRIRFRGRIAGLLASAALISGVVAAQDPAPAPASNATPEPVAEKAPAGPRLEVPEVEVDLGQVVRGETAEARFALHNNGTETLRILRAKPG